MNPPLRSVLGCLLVLACGAVAPRVAAQSPPAATSASTRPAPPETLAVFAPADVGLFVELTEAPDVLALLIDPQIWITLAELAGQPAGVDETAAWRERIRATTKLEPRAAINALFSRQVAFVGLGPGRAQDAVVLCRPLEPPPQLLQQMDARVLETPADPQTYQLYHNIGAVTQQDVLIFGDLLPPRGLFRAFQQQLARPAPPLQAATPFRTLRAALPDQLDGLIFARLDVSAPIVITPEADTPPTTLPAATLKRLELPGPLRGARTIMIGLERAADLLHFTATSDARSASDSDSDSDSAPPTTGPAPGALLRHLPADTLFAWEGRLDFDNFARRVQTLPERNVARVALRLQQESAVLAAFFEQLGERACITAGLVQPGGRPADAPPVPAAAILLPTHDPAAAQAGLRRVVEIGTAAYALFALANGGPPLPAFEQRRAGEVELTHLDLSGLLRAGARQAIGEVHVCWTVQDNVLIVASHEQWLRRIITARKQTAPPLAAALQNTAAQRARGIGNLVVIRSHAGATVGRQWLDYIAAARPELLDESWWRARQPNGGNDRLGIRATLELEQRRLRVTAVLPELPADGRIEVGDHIVGFGDRRFRSDDLVAEFRSGIEQRPNARWFDLLVERNGVVRRVRLPLPFIDPIQALRRAVAIGGAAQKIVYADEPRHLLQPRSYLTIQLPPTDAPGPPTDDAPPASPAP